jgi:hypothetical protein
MAFAPANVLELEEYRLTQARLERLEAFRSRIDLVAQPGSTFDLEVRVVEASVVARRLRWLRPLPFLAVSPDLLNIAGRAVNVTTLARFDPKKRRLFSSVTAPLRGDPSRQWRAYADIRGERWNFLRGEEDVSFRKTAAGVELGFVPRSWFQWRTGFEIAARRFDGGVEAPNGSTLRHRLGMAASLVRIPARRISVNAGAEADLGRLFGAAGGMFTRAEASVEASWFPQARGSDYETRIRLSAGAAGGALPLDEMYYVGIERDTPLWLRGHAGTREGKKGSAPVGRRYGLLNVEWFKRIYDGGLVAFHAGPFTDIAGVRDVLGRHRGRAFVDPGVQVRVRVLEATGVRVSYSRGVVYALLERAVR